MVGFGEIDDVDLVSAPYFRASSANQVETVGPKRPARTLPTMTARRSCSLLSMRISLRDVGECARGAVRMPWRRTPGSYMKLS